MSIMNHENPTTFVLAIPHNQLLRFQQHAKHSLFKTDVTKLFRKGAF